MLQNDFRVPLESVTIDNFLEMRRTIVHEIWDFPNSSYGTSFY